MTIITVVTVCAALGVLVGSFLNVVIHRVPLGQSVVHPRSRCPTCSRQLTAVENVPVVSWVVQRGRCRGCATGISPRYPTVEVLTGAVFALVAYRVGFAPELPGFLYLAAIGVALAAIDLDTHRLPDAIVKPAYVIGPALLGVAAASSGELDSLRRAGIGMVALYAVYFVMRKAYPRGMGRGDVKLAGVLGLYLAWLGWAELVVGGFLAFLLGGVVGLPLMFTRAGRKTRIPFGPYMLAGALLGMLVGARFVQAYLALIGL